MLELTTAQLLVLEWAAVVLNIGFTIGIAWNRRWGWLLGIVASFIGVVLYAFKGAWAMTVLNAFYAVMGVYGYVAWGRSSDQGRIRRWRLGTHTMVLVCSFLVTRLGAYLLSEHLNGTLPGMDAFISVFGFVATWMMAHRLLENWLYWTIGDVVAIYFNWALGYEGYALLNGVYVVFSVVGLVRWYREWREQGPRATEPTLAH